MLGVQPWLRPDDYRSAGALYARLAGLLAVARRVGWLGARTIVALPEYTGTWLLVAGGPPPVYRAHTLSAAAPWLIAGHAPAFLLALRRSRSRDRVREALFRCRAAQVARSYHAVCAALARSFGVTLVGGSLVLPVPRVADGELRPGDGPLENVSAVYRPDGRAYELLARKVYPINEEAGFTAAGALGELPVFDTPAGPLGVAVCADSWYPQVYAALRGRGAELLAVPSYLAPEGVWRQPWGGYNGASAPPDVNPAHVGSLTEGEAWRTYALAGRLRAQGFAAGINVFLRGPLWDLAGDGRTVAVGVQGAAEAPERDGSALVNVWL
jgi:predicted amidohydrolase